MGHGPSLKQAILDKKVNAEALESEVKRVQGTMKNTEAQGLAYINNNTDGVILGADSKKPEIVFSNNQAYSKYSEEYSLASLNSVVDGVVDTAQKTMSVIATDGSDPKAITNLMGSIGGLIKAGLALAASSSTTSTDLSVTFSQFTVVSNGTSSKLGTSSTYAMYNAINSAQVAASNAWGNKALTIVNQFTVVAHVKTDPNLTYDKMLATDLAHLLSLEEIYDALSEKALEDGTDNLASLQFAKQLIADARESIKADRTALGEANLKALAALK